MPFTRVGGISHVIGGGDCPRLAKQSQLYSPVFCGMPGDRAVTGGGYSGKGDEEAVPASQVGGQVPFG